MAEVTELLTRFQDEVNTMTEDVLVITGPTGVGKTALSLALAESLGAEIISADSRQVYRPLTIGTAKPSPDELTRVRHHFINELDLEDDFSAGRFARDAEQRIAAIRAAGKRVLVVGGSVMYLRALQEGIAEVPEVPEAVRATLEHRYQDEGGDALYHELARVDPDAAATMDPTKSQRLIRALEVYHGTGRTLTYYQRNQPPPAYTYKTIVLHRDRSALYNRINARVDHMLDVGLLDEVRTLREHGFGTETNALRTIGYQEPMAYLDGAYDYDEMVRLVKRNSRRYAKRQLTWFRSNYSMFFVVQ